LAIEKHFSSSDIDCLSCFLEAFRTIFSKPGGGVTLETQMFLTFVCSFLGPSSDSTLPDVLEELRDCVRPTL